MRVKRKIIDSSLRKGRAAEVRLIERLHSLRAQVPWIGRVSLAGRKHDQVGVDVFISIKPQAEGLNIIVRVQVKSSLCGMLRHHDKYSNTTASTILVFIVNNECTDADIESRVLQALTKIRES